MKSKYPPAIVQSPVRAIKHAVHLRGGQHRVRNALFACGYDLRRVRHINVYCLLGTFPKPVLEAVLSHVRGL